MNTISHQYKQTNEDPALPLNDHQRQIKPAIHYPSTSIHHTSILRLPNLKMSLPKYLPAPPPPDDSMFDANDDGQYVAADE